MSNETSVVADDSTLDAASAVQQHTRSILAHATFGTAAHAQMVRSAKNARRKPRDLRELKALVRAQGLLQNLVCHTQLVDGAPSGLLEVVAGDGRWQVIGELIAEGDLPEDYQILYQLVDEADAVLVSLAENCGRTPLHPADLSEGMLALAAAGRGVADIALAFGVAELTVRQRLKLANVAPALFALYRADQASYEQLAALAVSDDHAAQQAAWDSLPSWQRQPARLRQLLTAHSVPLRDDPLARYVGVKAYEAAGGLVTRDLFSDRGDGYIEDAALLERLAQAKLERYAKRLGREPWHWVLVQPRSTPAQIAAYAQARQTRLAPTPEQQAQLDTLERRADALQDALDTDDADADTHGATVRELADIDLQRGRLRMALTRVDPGDAAVSGVLVTVDEDGKPRVLRGLIRPQDKARLVSAAATPGKSRGPHSERLLTLLSAQRSVALRVELASQPGVALLVLAHRLLSEVFFAQHGRQDAVQLSLRAPDLPAEVEAGAAWRQWQARREALAAQLPPAGGAALMTWLRAQSREEVDACIAFCLSCAVDGVAGAARASGGVEALAQAVGLDMHRYWQPTAQGYFDHVSKARIVEVVREALSPQAAVPLEAMRKEAAAKAAERALAGSDWLPEMLTGATAAQG